METLVIDRTSDLKEGLFVISSPVNVDMGMMTDVPFEVGVVLFARNYTDIDASIYCSNSHSLPESNLIDNNYVHLKPTWCFYDKSRNKIYENIKVDYHTELLDDDGNIIGAIGKITFYFKDDLPSDDGFPTMLHVSLNIFDYEKDDPYHSKNYPEKKYYNSRFKLIYPLPVCEIIPSIMRFTTNGKVEVSNIQHPYNKIKTYITINGIPRKKYINEDFCGDDFPIMFNYLKEGSDPAFIHYNVIGFANDEYTYPNGDNGYLQIPTATISGKDVSGGWVEGAVTLEALANDAQLLAETTLDIQVTGMTVDQIGNYNWIQKLNTTDVIGFKTSPMDMSNEKVQDFMDTYGRYVVANNISEFKTIDWRTEIDSSIASHIIKTESCVGGILTDSNHRIWVSDFDKDIVYVYSEEGELSASIDIGAYSDQQTDIVPQKNTFGNWYGANKLIEDYEGNVWVGLYNGAAFVKMTPQLQIDSHFIINKYKPLSQMYALSIQPMQNGHLITFSLGVDHIGRKFASFYEWQFNGTDWTAFRYQHMYAEHADSYERIDSNGNLEDFLFSPVQVYEQSSVYYYFIYGTSTEYNAFCIRKEHPDPSPIRTFFIPNSTMGLMVTKHGLYKTIDLEGLPSRPLGFLTEEEYEFYAPPFIDDYVLAAWIDDKSTLNIVYGHEENGTLVGKNLYRATITPDMKLSELLFSKTELSEEEATAFISYTDKPFSSYRMYDDKYEQTGVTITGVSSPISVVNFSETIYDLRNVNESWNMYEQIMSYIKQEHLKSFKSLWDDFIKHIVGTSDSSYQSIGRQFYDKIANFVLYHSDISTSNIKSLASLMTTLSLSLDFTVDDAPAMIEYWVNKLSVQYTKLIGEDVTCDRNFVLPKYEDSIPCSSCGVIHKSNIGAKIESPVLEIGTPIVIRDTYNTIKPFELFYPNVSGDTSQLEEYGFNSPFDENYEVYEYMPTVSTPRQSEGLLNRYDEHNTLDATDINYYEWWRDDGHVNRIYRNVLYDGFDLPKGEYIETLATEQIYFNRIDVNNIYTMDAETAVCVGVAPIYVKECSKGAIYNARVFILSDSEISGAPTFETFKLLTNVDVESSTEYMYNVPITKGRNLEIPLYVLKDKEDEVMLFEPYVGGIYITGELIPIKEDYYISRKYIAFNYQGTLYGLETFL